ncbi:hypothetical protein [Microscilla marina]|uniref:Uncharacterized protein n=1 Tax=Microscilla marina ATCC 23134 TaxID=313606 RepID=A2A0L3_MICM2|nr:hypothetical protein [Microscilla marina]EAY23824.1 hypothetical protein M23134_07195 [Microscilla marina ATCC 23134]
MINDWLKYMLSQPFDELNAQALKNDYQKLLAGEKNELLRTTKKFHKNTRFYIITHKDFLFFNEIYKKGKASENPSSTARYWIPKYNLRGKIAPVATYIFHLKVITSQDIEYIKSQLSLGERVILLTEYKIFQNYRHNAKFKQLKQELFGSGDLRDMAMYFFSKGPGMTDTRYDEFKNIMTKRYGRYLKKIKEKYSYLIEEVLRDAKQVFLDKQMITDFFTDK